MSTTKALDPAFQGAGSRPGTEIWRIENFQPVPLPKSEHGKFYMGDSYIVMQTTSGRGGAYQYDLHFWLGKDTSQDESGTAAIKTVELDASLGGKAVQHREVQGHESDKFLSYFKPCIIPLEGGVASGFKTPEEDEFETRLYICKGKRVVKVKQVPFSRASLNHDDVFILDTKDKIYQFNGANSNIQERAKALEVTQFLKDTYHGGVCNIAIVDDGKLQAETDSGEFWVCFGGFAPIGRKVVSDDDVIPDATPAKLFSVADGKLEPMEGELSKGALENHKCYILDCGNEIYTWFGRATQVDERKSASQAAEDLVTSHGRPKATYITRVIQGYESQSFKSYFESWPMGSNAGAEEGRGKVAAFWKQQGGTKGATKGDAAEEVPPLLEVGVKIEVWRVDGNQKTSIAKEDIGKFYSGDCYIVLYTYHSGDKKEDFYLCWWVGKDSVEEEQKAACQLSSAMFNKLKERPVLGRIYQGKEPSQFIALFQPMIVLKGGLSSGYKSSVEAKGSKDETYAADGVALFRISGTASHNNKVIQVDPVAASLNTYECCVLQTANAVFAWQGTQSLVEQQQLGVKVAEILKPGGPLKYAKEGTETQVFWSALGGKNTFDSKKTSQNTVRDPHLYAFTVVKGKFQVEEIYNFAQDDLLTEDILMLDTHAEVFVWVGQAVDPKEKQHTFEMGENYVELATTTDGLSPQVPLYKLIEGHEPCFFTSYFPSWDAARANVQGNSFQKKATLMFGSNSTERSSQGGGQRAAAMAALSGSLTAEKKPGSPAHSSASQRAAAMAALSGSGAADKKPGSPSAHEEHQEEAEPAAEEEENAFEGAIEGTYSYDQLKAKSENPVTGIDFKRREAYLTDEDFEKVFGMLKEDFYKMPRWKQDTQKKKLDLF